MRYGKDEPIKQVVADNRGAAPDEFLDELIAWGKEAPDDIFAWNDASDIYTFVKRQLGPYDTLAYRRGVMLEVMRVLAGYESSWDWTCGRDTNNPKSDTPIETEAGAFQVSADSMRSKWPELRELVIREAKAADPETFQAAMKSNHKLAMEYTARLLRRTVRHHGTVRDGNILGYISVGAAKQFTELLGRGPVERPPLDGAAPEHDVTQPLNYQELLPKPSKLGINQGLSSPTAQFMTNLLGLPRQDFTRKCQEPTDAAYLKRIDTRRVGPIRVRGLIEALNSLQRVFDDVQREMPDLYALIGTEGMMCCRLKKIPGQVSKDPSNHTWGAAIDLTIGGKSDDQGDDKVMRGLMILARYFNAHGWVWGAAFPVEDAMHFEVSTEQLMKWRDAGLV